MFFKNFKRVCIADVTVLFIPLGYCRREKRILKKAMFNKERGNVVWISCLMLTITIWYSIRKDGDSHRAFIQKKNHFSVRTS